MRAVVAAVFLFLLAGCGEPPPPAERLPAVEPAPEPERSLIDLQVSLESRGGCTASVCFAEGLATLVHEVPVDRRATSLVLDAEPVDTYDGAVEWELSCITVDDEDPSCHRDLGHGHEPLPLHLELHGLSLPPATKVLLLLRPDRVAPAVDFVMAFPNPSSHVTGWVEETPLPAGERPFRLETVAVSLDGHSGPCAISVEPGCTSTPGWSLELPVDEGTVVAANLTLTWTSTSLADEVLRLWVSGSCQPTCPRAAEVEGRSPLALQRDDLDLRGYVQAIVIHGDPTGMDPTGVGFSYAGTRTPFHLEGSLTVRLPPLPAPEPGA